MTKYKFQILEIIIMIILIFVAISISNNALQLICGRENDGNLLVRIFFNLLFVLPYLMIKNMKFKYSVFNYLVPYLLLLCLVFLVALLASLVIPGNMGGYDDILLYVTTVYIVVSVMLTIIEKVKTIKHGK